MSTSAVTLARPPITRLTLVELRKMVNTRAGFWLQMVMALLMVAVVTIVGIVGDREDHSFRELIPVAIAPALFLLPVIGILLVTSEWSQRTTLITFTVVPERVNVLVAKLLAGLLLVLAVLGVALVLAAVATAVTGGDWNFSFGFFGQSSVELVSRVGMGIAFGAAIQASAPAIVIFFVLPTALSALASLSFLEKIAPWLDTNRAFESTTDHLLSATEWGHIGTSLALWVLLPLAVGAWRIARDDIA